MSDRGRAPARPLLLVVLTAVLAGLPSLLPGFIHDDHRIIEQNELVRDPGRLPAILTHGYWTVNDEEVPNLYRPVTILSFALNHVVAGLHPFGYRLVNLLLHALVAALVFAVGRRVFDRPRPTALDPSVEPALLAGLLFAVHPVHTEVLGLVVGRGDLLAALGAMLAVLFFLEGRDRAAASSPKPAWPALALSLLASAAGFLSKENAVAVPFIALAADLTRPRARGGAAARPAWGYHAASALVFFLLLWVRASVLGQIGVARFTHYIDNPIAYQPFVLGRLTALKALASYAFLLVFPLRLSIDHSYNALPPALSALEPPVVLGGLILLAAASGVAAAWRRRPAAAFSLLFTGLALAPVSNLLYPIGTIMAERLLYLPSVGFCLLVAALLPSRTLATKGRPVLFKSILIGALGLLALRSVVRLVDWRDDRTIFAAAVAVTPASARAQFNYGTTSEEAGDRAAAERGYRAAIGIWPGFADAQYNLAGLLSRGMNWEEAIEHYQKALAEQPENITYLVNLGHALNRAGRPGESLAVLEKAVGLDPRSDRGWNNLGAARLALGRTGDAVKAYSEAARLVPGNADYLVNLGLARSAAGDFQAAAQAFAAAAEIRPADAILRYQMGRALEQAGRVPEAAAAYRESILLSPASPVPQRSLGLLQFRTGDLDGALQSLERALTLDTRGEVMDDEARSVLERLRRNAPSSAPGAGRDPDGR